MKVLPAGFRALLSVGVMVCGLFLWGCKDQRNIDTWVVVVDTEQVFASSVPSEKGRAHLEQVKSRLQSGLDEVRKVYGAESRHPSPDTVRDAEMKAERYFQNEVASVDAEINRVLNVTVRAWADAHPGAVVMSRRQVLAVDDSHDITREILPAMVSAEVAFSPLPEVRVVHPEKNEKGADQVSREKK